jgi:ketosteroid isomerase-like protein
MPEPSSLLIAYAAAVDGRDLEALRRLFLPDATLAVRRGDAAPEVHEGHAGLADVIAMLGAFEATLHEVSSVIVEIDKDGAGASGTSVCVAHHVRRREGEGREAEDLILHGRYTDRFARDGKGAWRFASRELHVLWTEKRPVRLA